MIVDNSASCCSHYIAASIVASFKIMTKLCFLKSFKTEEKSMLQNTEINNLSLDLETEQDAVELLLAKINVF